MVQINFALKEVNCKLVYYGPGRSGKTTNLEQVHKKAPDDSKGDLVSINTETDRTLYFDFLPLNLGKVAGMDTKFQLYTVPGQVYYNATRKLVLQGVDGVVFVADSSPHMMDENKESIDNMIENLVENGIDPDNIPIILQFNKRDIDGALPVEILNKELNRNNWTTVEAIAAKGEGVFPTLKKLSGLVIAKLNEQGGTTPPAPKPPAPKPVAPTPAPAPKAVEPVQMPVEPQAVAQVASTTTATEPAPRVEEPVVQEAPSRPAPKPLTDVENQSDAIAARLAKMRKERSDSTSMDSVSNVKEDSDFVPQKLPSTGIVGFFKRLFGIK